MSVVLVLLIAATPSQAQSNDEWTWISGADTAGNQGSYGTKGVPAFSNMPPNRRKAASWVGPDGNFWLFGGESVDSDGNLGTRNDLWRYNPSSGMWTWVDGSKQFDQAGTYGTQGTPSSSNMPGARYSAMAWTGPNGDLWLMGGNGYDYDGESSPSRLNDLWRYDTNSGEWTWVDGGKTPYQNSVFGTKGTASDSNIPGARQGSATWTGPNGHLWLLGGYGADLQPQIGQLNDLWKYDITADQWTWVAGTDTAYSNGQYGTKGTPSPQNRPGGRQNSVTWTGPDGDLWLMGGFGFDGTSYYGTYYYYSEGGLNDLWRYDIETGEWTWVSGSENSEQTGTYGTRGTGSPSNVPGSRHSSVSWKGPDGDLWLFGGQGYGAKNLGALNDVWRYNIDNGEWTWENGSKNRAQTGSYVEGKAASNTPGARRGPAGWKGPNDHFWLMGGYGNPSSLGHDFLNDFWRLGSESGSLELDGSSDYAKIADGNALDVTNALTLEMWVNFDDINKSGWSTLAMKGNTSQSYGLILNTGSSNKTLRFYHNGAGSGSTDFDWGTLSADTWYHIAATYDGSHAKIYIDGTERVSASVSGSVNTTTDSLFIGQNKGASKYRLDGTMSEVRIWNKALTQQEITDRMNLSVSGKESNLAGAWLSRIGAISGVRDQSGNANNLLIVSGKTVSNFPPVKNSVSGNEGWRLLAAPSPTSTYGNLLGSLWTQGYSGSDGGTVPSSNVFYYDEPNGTWQTPSSSSNIVGTSSNSGVSNRGTLVYVYADDDYNGSSDPFPKPLVIRDYTEKSSVQIPLSYNDSDGGGNGWHLVSNPFPVAIDWPAVVNNDDNINTWNYMFIWDHSMNSGAGGYRVNAAGTGPILPSQGKQFNGRIPAFQSFWVKAQSSGAKLNLSRKHQNENTALYKGQQQTSPFIHVKMNGKNFTDGISLVFPNNSEQAGYDIPKLRSLSNRHANIFIEGDADKRWIAKHFIQDQETNQWTVPVDVDITVNGTYTLNWEVDTIPESWSLELEEMTTGKRYDLEERKSFDFTVNANQSKSKEKGNKPPIPVPPGSAKAKDNGPPKFRLHISTTPQEQQQQVPAKAALQQNYPNPFNPATVISYDVPEQSKVSLEVFDMLGQRVATLVNEQKSPGSYQVDFDASGMDLASGLYMYRLRVGSKVMTKKMTLIK